MAMSRSRGGVVVDDAAVDDDVAAGDRLEAGDHPEDRALAAAGGADEHDELAVADLEVDAVHDLERAVLLEELPDLDVRHRFPLQAFSIVQLCSWNGRKVSSARAAAVLEEVDLVAEAPAVGQADGDGAAGAGGLVGAQDRARRRPRRA